MRRLTAMAVAAENIPMSSPEERSEFETLLATWRAFDAPDGFRVEISEGALRMYGLPAGRHGKIVAIINRVLVSAVPEELTVFQLVGVLITALEKLYIPDLVVAALDALDDESLLDPAEVLLAVEVTSPSNAHIDRQEKLTAYGRAGVLTYLLVDRVGNNPAVTLYTDPVDGEYRHILRVPFGESINVPLPFDVDLDTSQFPH
jgi:Uma2 family endonuclease